MLKLSLGLMLILPSLSFAQAEELPNIRIKDVKVWIRNQDPQLTCADDYLKRRKQLAFKMGLAPVSIVAASAAGFFAGGVIGHAAYSMTTASTGSWADLGYTVGGAALGTFAGAGITVASTTIGTVDFFNIQRLLKAIVESHTTSGKALTVLHRKYSEQYPEDLLSIQDFTTKLAELDLTGKLCDGSIVAPKRHKKGRRLKQNLATKKEILAHIHKQLT